MSFNWKIMVQLKIKKIALPNIGKLDTKHDQSARLGDRGGLAISQFDIQT